MSAPIRVGIADDQHLLRDGLRIILNSAPDITVVGEAEDGEAAVALAERERPDVMLLDIRMPRVDGIEATRRIRQIAPATKIALLTTHDVPELVGQGIQAGASGYLLKDASAEEVCAAVRAVARGQIILQGQSAARLVASAASATGATPTASDFGLTDRERDVLRLIAQGRTNAEIASELVVTDATVKTHINHIFAKLGARDRADAILLAQRHHLV